MYVKVYGHIVDSSIWDESSDTRIAWITLLVKADSNGIVRATDKALARAARISLEAMLEALRIFQKPDSHSLNPDNEGRRIERVPGGYLLLNYEYHKELQTRAEEREKVRQRVAAYRARKKQDKEAAKHDVTENVTVCNECNDYGNNSSSSSSISSSVSNIGEGVQGKGPVTAKDMEAWFETCWKAYPKRVGKKAALRHFKASVKCEKDRDKMLAAIDNYMQSRRYASGYVMDGSTFFNNWQDWEELPESEKVKDGRRDEYVRKIQDLEAHIEKLKAGKADPRLIKEAEERLRKMKERLGEES